MIIKLIDKILLFSSIIVILESCGAGKPKVSAEDISNKAAIAGIEAESVNKPEYVLKIKAPVETDGATYIQTFKAESAMNKSNVKGSFTKNTPNIKVEQAQIEKNKKSSGDSYSNFFTSKNSV